MGLEDTAYADAAAKANSLSARIASRYHPEDTHAAEFRRAAKAHREAAKAAVATKSVVGALKAEVHKRTAKEHDATANRIRENVYKSPSRFISKELKAHEERLKQNPNSSLHFGGGNQPRDDHGRWE